MFASQMILSATCIGFALWLHWNERQGWPNESYDSKLDKDYLRRRMRSRRRVHLLFGGCGVLMAVAAVAGPGRIFVAAWTIIALALMTVVMLAALDALRTQRYDKQKMKELRKQTLGKSDSTS